MKSGKPAAAYPAAFAVFIGALIVMGAIALWLIYRGEPAFPVKVFGSARTSLHISPVRWIRPSDVTALPHGHFDPKQLLPLPPADDGAGGPPGDALYQSLGNKHFRQTLDAARLAAQAGKETLASALYEKLQSRFPDNRLLITERATVLGGFGRNRDAANLLIHSFDKFPADAGMRMLAAQNLWYAGDLLRSDSVLTLVLRTDPGNTEALELRRTIRPLTEPDVRTAQRWVQQNPGLMEHLMLARAYVREEQYARAIPEYRAVVFTGERSDSLLIEASSAAAAADSVALLDELTTLYIARHPEDIANRLRLARAYSWRSEYEKSLVLYDDVVARTNDAAIRLEKANVLMWAGAEKQADIELARVLAAEPRNVEAIKLKGDIALYRGDWKNALAAYQTVNGYDAGYPGVTEAIAQAYELREAERLARLPQPQPEAYTVSIESYSDNQSFTWASAQATRSFRSGRNSAALTVDQQVAQAPVAGGISTNPAYGAHVVAEIRPNDRLLLSLTGGVQQFDAIGTFPNYAAELSIYDFLGTTASVRFTHEPAMRRALTLVALHANTTVNALQLELARSSARNTFAMQAEREAFSSRFGGSTRWSGSASWNRALTPRVTVGASIAAVTADAAPVMAGAGDLYWSPEYFVEPMLTARYQTKLSAAWSVGAGLSAGYDFVRERPAAQQRFSGNSFPAASASADLTYGTGPWQVGIGAAYGGAVGDGYKATSVRVQGSYTLK